MYIVFVHGRKGLDWVIWWWRLKFGRRMMKDLKQHQSCYRTNNTVLKLGSYLLSSASCIEVRWCTTEAFCALLCKACQTCKCFFFLMRIMWAFYSSSLRLAFFSFIFFYSCWIVLKLKWCLLVFKFHNPIAWWLMISHSWETWR